MARQVGEAFRSALDSTRYPFADNATLENSDGIFIPESVFLDASLYVIGGLERQYISQVVVTGDLVTISIGDLRRREIATAAFDPLSPPSLVEVLDLYGRPAGVLVSEPTRLALFQSWPQGTHTFTNTQTPFTAGVCIPTPEVGFRGFLLEDGSVVSRDIWLVGENGVVLRHDEQVEPDPDVPGEFRTVQLIRVDVVGDPLFRRSLCEGVFTTPRFVKTVTFKEGCRKVTCGPDANGNLSVFVTNIDAPTTILRVTTVPGGLKIEAAGEPLEAV